ncbi:MAG: hypothetical protein J6Z36_01350, partial [Clostridia bacterium]|nr:hypothetical protein [Clostridia bacterium]
MRSKKIITLACIAAVFTTSLFSVSACSGKEKSKGNDTVYTANQEEKSKKRQMPPILQHRPWESFIVPAPYRYWRWQSVSFTAP